MWYETSWPRQFGVFFSHNEEFSFIFVFFMYHQCNNALFLRFEFHFSAVKFNVFMYVHTKIRFLIQLAEKLFVCTYLIMDNLVAGFQIQNSKLTHLLQMVHFHCILLLFCIYNMKFTDSDHVGFGWFYVIVTFSLVQ